eukprot:PLAT12528.2.p2 GENE.PLAT12528.2~~PLAT12528.2.p2  ORF type:complete len:756 (+),score=263.14 PLAT12528.2:76-2343(+)
MKATHCILLALFVVGAYADVYMHNPRGSNDRNCENNVNRNNGNRLFDSQNNAKGGYACPRNRGGPGTAQTKRTYYVGSQLPVEWTQQHGCGGNERVQCEIIVQYGCEDTMDPNGSLRSGTNIAAPRDGTPQNQNDAATDTIPNNQNNAVPNNAANRRFGMHETVEYYQECQNRARNKGLYTADQNLNRNDARATRQNPNGNRNGLECPEERDYYPYWHPTPFRDIAVLVDDEKLCETRKYATLSQNVDAKGYCIAANPAQARNAANNQFPNNAADCAAAGHKWQTFRFYQGFTGTVDAPECKKTQFARVNHLGNAAGASPGLNQEGNLADAAQPNRYLWTVPNTPDDNCVLRLRYNMSTTSVPYEANATRNGNNAYVTQDPYFAVDNTNVGFLSLAVNTNQLARTFQDRSFVFAIKARPTSIVGAKTVLNVNLRGKRGNIVQTYPAVEYDFIPNEVAAERGSVVHITMTGTDFGPRRGCNNARGGGPIADGGLNANQRQSRANLALSTVQSTVLPGDIRTAAATAGKNPFVTASGQDDYQALQTMAFLNQNTANCLTQTQLDNINNDQRQQANPKNCAALNQAKAVVDIGPLTVGNQGVYNFVDTRNNNFSNRANKWRICVGVEGSPAACSGYGASGSAIGGTDTAPGVDTNPVFQLPGQKEAAKEAAKQPKLDKPTTAPQDKDNDAVGDGEKKGCEDMLWSLLEGLGTFGAAALGVGMFSIGVGATIMFVWFSRRNQGAGRTDQQWMSTPHASL